MENDYLNENLQNVLYKSKLGGYKVSKINDVKGLSPNNVFFHLKTAITIIRL